jgi:hypothetical protein
MCFMCYTHIYQLKYIYCQMIAHGDVSCFVLTREDLIYILSEGDDCSNASSRVSSTANSMTDISGKYSNNNNNNNSSSSSSSSNNSYAAQEGLAQYLGGTSEPMGPPPMPKGRGNAPRNSSSISSKGIFSAEEGKHDDKGTAAAADVGDDDEGHVMKHGGRIHHVDEVISLQPTSAGSQQSHRRVCDTYI